MKKKKISKMRILIIAIILCLLSASCRDSITIDRYHIYDTGWRHGRYHGFRIAKINFPDTTISVDNPNIKHFDFASRIIDTNFCFDADIEPGYPDRIMTDVFFDKKTESVVWLNCNNISVRRDSIGLLELNTWYMIFAMGGTQEFYVYVANDGATHVYSSGPTNW